MIDNSAVRKDVIRAPMESANGLQQPSWLLNNPDDDVWLFKRHLDGLEESASRVSWALLRVGSGSISTGREHHWKSLAKRFTYHYMESDKTQCRKPSTLATAAREYRSLFAWLCFERLCQDLRSVTKSDIAEYERHVKSLQLKRSSVLSKLSLVRTLWILRDEVGDGLLFDPYVGVRSLAVKASSFGVPDGRTRTIEPDDFFRLLNFCLGTLERTDEVLALLPDYLALERGSSLKRKRAAREFWRCHGRSPLDYTNDVRLLYGAAVVVVLSLLGERKHELCATKLIDAMTIINGERDELHGTVHKTAGTISGKHTARPVIAEVITALSVVVRLTEITRESYDGDLLFLRLPFESTANNNPQIELTTGKLYLLLDRVADACNLRHPLRPHMFRRAFALIWAWRYELGDMHLLSKLLYHNNEKFTKYYTEDDDVWRFMPEAEQELAFDVMEKALLGTRATFGGFGKILQRYGRRLLANVTVLTPEKVHHFVERLFASDHIHVVAQEHGYCFMSAKRAHHAACSTDGIGPDYVRRQNRHCVACANFCVTENRRTYWEHQRAAHEKVIETTNIHVLKAAAEEGRDLAVKVIGWMDRDKGST